MPYCYIIHSDALNRFYIGITTESVESRLKKHNDHTYGTHRFTAKASDWKEYLVIETESTEHAMRLEKKIKRMKSAVYIQNLKKYPALVSKILKETKSN